ncbi:MAG TPA: BMP family ABC transporter substrate-binding protein [Dermatophilaceae bacterium]|nr:BMP family ABC transporter substrate-binding protein [Dermatophilaceae bacterium]
MATRFMTRRRRAGIVLAAAAALVAACSSNTAGSGGNATGGTSGTGTTSKMKVAFVYVGPVGDAGWTKKHDDGRKELEAAMGDKVQTTFLESVPEGAESEATFERLAREGNKIIFATSFGYMDQMLAVAAKYPDVVFMHATGYKTAANMGTYFGAAEEARYLTGMAASSMTKSNKLGYVAAFPIPEVIRGINAFTLGAQKVNPNVTVDVVWTSTWFNPTTEKEAAQSLLNKGIDVIGQHQDTPGPGEAAEAAGAKWVGYNDDMSRFAAKAWLTAPVWDWGPFYIKTAKDVMAGTWKSEQYYGTMADGLVKLAPVADSVPADIRAAIEDTQKKIISGEFAPFTGPISKQDGSSAYAAGAKATLAELLKMDYFVKGVNGSATGKG